MLAERGEDRGPSRGGGRGSEGQSMPTARLRSASLGADLELQGGATKAGPGTPGRRLTGPSEARLPPRRVLGSCPGGQWLGQGGAAEEQAGRTSGLAGRAGSPAAAPDAVAMVEKRVCHPFVHGLAPWFGAGSGVTPRAPRSMGRRAPQPEARLARHGQRGKRCRAPSARLGRNQGGPTRAVTTQCRQEQGRARRDVPSLVCSPQSETHVTASVETCRTVSFPSAPGHGHLGDASGRRRAVA